MAWVSIGGGVDVPGVTVVDSVDWWLEAPLAPAMVNW